MRHIGRLQPLSEHFVRLPNHGEQAEKRSGIRDRTRRELLRESRCIGVGTVEYRAADSHHVEPVSDDMGRALRDDGFEQRLLRVTIPTRRNELLVEIGG